MGYQPHRVRVARTRQISPHFQRITLHGVENVGPKDTIRDIRIKVLIPTNGQLPDLPEENWLTAWKDLAPQIRGHIRTYSIRAFRRDLSNNTPDELDIDFVLHPHAAGPASVWATKAQVGDELLIIAPTRDDESGHGIEFAPGTSSRIVMLGDETALPAIAKTLEEWPEGVQGDVFIEIPCISDAQQLEVPPGVSVQWLARAEDERDSSGEQLYSSLVKIVDNALSQAPRESPSNVLERNASPTTTPAGENDASVLVWETPSFSQSGEDISYGGSEDQANTEPLEPTLAGTYFWIAGESSVVVRMRRLLVKECQVPRNQVSFMGYWKRGYAAKG